MPRYLAAMASSIALLTLCCVVSSSVPAEAAGEHEISGKVMGVFHEPVNINNQWMDKVSLTIRPCNVSGTSGLVTYSYTPSSVKDEAVAGQLFNQGAISARHLEQKNQYMQSINGHVTLKVNDQNQILKTTYWGYNYECGHNVDTASAGGTSSAPASGMQGNTKTPAATPAPTTPGKPSFRFGKFGVDL